MLLLRNGLKKSYCNMSVLDFCLVNPSESLTGTQFIFHLYIQSAKTRHFWLHFIYNFSLVFLVTLQKSASPLQCSTKWLTSSLDTKHLPGTRPFSLLPSKHRT